MKRKALALTIMLVFLAAAIGASFVKLANGKTTTVPNNYSTIQGAINAADAGDTVFVKNGIYHETLVISKSISVIGENRDSTIIDANHNVSIIIEIRTSYVTISGFTIQNNSGTPGSGGTLPPAIYASDRLSSYLNISYNTVRNTVGGIQIGSHNVVVGNNVAYCAWGIGVGGDNLVENNNIVHGLFSGLGVYGMNNTIFHNNIAFIQADYFSDSLLQNRWDNGVEGNYWGDYKTRYPNASEIDATGTWDTPYLIGVSSLRSATSDNHPLMFPYGISLYELSSLPEFPSLTILPLFLIATLLATLVYCTKHKADRISNTN